MALLFPSLEAIKQQHNSQLASGLVALFQDIINYRDAINTSIDDRIKETITYAKKKMNAAFPQIVQKATGLKCRKISYSPSIDFGYACLMEVGDKYGYNAMMFIGEYSGTGIDNTMRQLMKWNDVRCTTAQEIMTVTNSLNKDTGIYSSDTLYDGRKVSFTMYFDPYSAFLLQEAGHIKNKPFTAEEIAAIVIHEIGHMHSMLEHALDQFMRVQVATAAFDYFTQHASNEEKVKLVGVLYSDQLGIQKKTNELLKNRKDTVGGYILDGCVALFNILVCAFELLALPAIIAGNIITKLCDELVLSTLRNSIDKTSDLGQTAHNFKLVERLADEFVVKHGLGSALISAISKLDYNISGGAGTWCSNKNSSLAYNSFKLTYILGRLLSGHAMYRLDEHDSMPTRGIVAMEKTIEIFKSKLSPELLNYYIEDYERLQKVLDNRSTVEQMETVALSVGKLMDYIIMTPASILATGRFSSEYENLIYKINSLINNKLYFRAAKLQQLLNLKSKD